jgi:hypothetical protein
MPVIGVECMITDRAVVGYVGYRHEIDDWWLSVFCHC